MISYWTVVSFHFWQRKTSSREDNYIASDLSSVFLRSWFYWFLPSWEVDFIMYTTACPAIFSNIVLYNTLYALFFFVRCDYFPLIKDCGFGVHQLLKHCLAYNVYNPYCTRCRLVRFAWHIFKALFSPSLWNMHRFWFWKWIPQIR